MLLAVYYRIMGHLGSLKSTQEARLLRFFRALQTSRVLHNSIVHAKAWTNCLARHKATIALVEKKS